MLQICAETLTRLHLPGTMLAPAEADMESIDATDNENLGKLKDLLFN